MSEQSLEGEIKNFGLMLLPKSNKGQKELDILQFSEYVRMLKNLCWQVHANPIDIGVTTAANILKDVYYIRFRTKDDAKEFADYIKTREDLPFSVVPIDHPIGINAYRLFKRLE